MDDTVKVELERIHDEDNRQNHRIDQLEVDMKGIHEISQSVHELAINMQHMLEELERQSARIAVIENRPLDSIKTARNALINTVVGVVAGAAIAAIIAYVK